MKSNFEFLNRYWPVLAQLGANAENLPVYCLLDVVLSVLSAVLSKNVILVAYEPKPETPVISRKNGGKP